VFPRKNTAQKLWNCEGKETRYSGTRAWNGIKHKKKKRRM
jgi:hypothetical protein